MIWLMIPSEIERVEAVRTRVLPEGAESPSHARAPMKMKRGGVAKIKISGPLLAVKDDWLDYFGVDYTVYSDIIEQLAEAAEGKANRIDFEIDSPGGTVEGLSAAMDAIAGTPIKTRAVVSGMAASAAYMLASQTGGIVALDDLDLVGSIGVATTRYVSERYKDIANTDSPKKRPDVSTSEGVAAVQEELDDIYQILAEKIADGRGVSVDAVKQDYGRGSVMTARTALGKKVIDSIIEKQPAAGTQSAATKGDNQMITLAEFKEQNPAGYQEAVAEGVAEGVTKERSRVEAHLIAADGGDLEAAHKAIRGGLAYDDVVKAQHDSFARKQVMITGREEESAAPVLPEGEQVTPEAAFKTGIEAACPGVEWEVM